MYLGIRRYLGQKICIVKENWHEIPPEFKDEFNKDLLKTNLYHSKIVAIVLLIAAIPLLYMDFFNYLGGMWINVIGYRLLFCGHVLLMLVMLIPLIIVPIIKPDSEYKKYLWQRACLICFLILILIDTAIISMADQKTSGEITAYIIGVLGVAATVYLKPVTSLFIYLLSFVIFLAGLSQVQTNPEILDGHYINSSFLVMIGWIFSVTLFNTRVRDFLNKKGLEIYASIDYLTGCLNRRAFINQLGQEIERAQREQTTISILLFDIDYFKQVNDRFGHLAGDCVLKQVINLFNNSSRNYDFIGRFGGEEFIICLPNTNLSVASEVAERFRCIIEETKIIFDSNTINFTISLGVAALEPTYNENIDKFISRADSAMYRAKIKRNHVCLSSF
ncbi:MAG: hypothetical protein CVU90_01630 [Firmicutes bacterium HGW-Firmicutes-15]|nr:MAG: hypothetical protein CVU90_01630 [Firmicutes bacterium HGW-Firmicutes-15]